jgi:outer membrane lipoprotein-sorting protein
VFAAVMALALLPWSNAHAADEKEAVLRKLDAAAARFTSATADFEFDSVQTDPIPDKDVQKGTVDYERKGKAFQMAAHIRELNGRPSPKVYAYTAGVFKLFEPLPNQLTVFHKWSQYESYLMLGFGASGRDLEEKWEIKYLGQEELDGVMTDKLELVAKDPTVRKNIPKVDVWMDTERAVSVKQIFDEGPSEYRVCRYFNIKVNAPLPGDAFTFKTNGETQVVNR